MTDPKNPSQEEPKQAVFDSIQGAKTRDPDEVEEPAKEPGTTEAAEPAKEPGEAAKEKPGDERLGKALQRNAQLERQINSIGPWAQFGMAVGAVKGEGEALVQRYQQGKPLFLSDGGEITTEPSAPGEKPLTRRELAEYMQQEKATDHVMAELNDMAEKELPKFKELSRSQDFVQMLDWARQAAWNGNIPLDESVASWDNDFAAKEYTALKKAYTMKLASDPKVLEASKKAGEKQQKERDAEAAAAPSPTGTSTSSSQEEQAEKTAAEKSIEDMLKARGMGKSFGTIGSKR